MGSEKKILSIVEERILLCSRSSMERLRLSIVQNLTSLYIRYQLKTVSHKYTMQLVLSIRAL